MPVIIDCYNLLHHAMPQPLAGLDERRLIDLLSRSEWAGEGVTIVCDGVVKPGGLAESPVPGIDLVYSGRTRDADTTIIDLVNRSSAPRRLIVVTNDRTIQKTARRRRAACWSCGRFIGELSRVATNDSGNAGGSPSTIELTDDEVKNWADAFGVEIDEDEKSDSDRERKDDRSDIDRMLDGLDMEGLEFDE